MNKNFYPLIAVCSLICFFVSPTSATKLEPAGFQTISTSFVSKPANNSVNNAAPYLKITANVVTDAKRYTIEINTNADFSGTSIVRTSSKDYERTMLFTGLAYSKTYYARVKTDLSAVYGKVTKFQTRAEMFPIVAAPGDGIDQQNPVVLKVYVNGIPDAKRYTVELNTKSDFSGSSIFLSSVENLQRTFISRDLNYNTTYFARVKSDINTKAGPVTRFTTRSPIAAKRLWGLTTNGGAHDFGTVFSFSIDSGTFTLHHDYLENSDYPAAYTHGSLVPAPDGGFYGNSECANGGTCGNGETFYVSPLGQYELRSSPGIHAGNLMLASNNHIYVLHDWINTFRGGIIKLDADSTGFDLSQIVFRFSARAQGLNPKAALLELTDGYLYGMAPYGGSTNHGVIYRLKHDGSGFQVVYNFSLSTSGGYPQGSLIKGSDGYLYGTTSSGGNFNFGTIFRILPDGANFSKLHDFNGSSGKYPQSNLAELNGVLFGTAKQGGNADAGVVFKIKSDGTGFQKILDFNGASGSQPIGAPTVDPSGLVYGMTSAGGLGNMGVIYKLRTDGSGFQKLFDFTHTTGGIPDGCLTLSEDLFPSQVAAKAKTFAAVSSDGKSSYQVGVFPNPFNTSFQASIEGVENTAVQVVITDMQGQVMSRVYVDANSTIELGEHLQKGIYVLKVIKGDEVSQHRVVKR
jgi:uncharacterized repeat protein (TIGR03803 family)